MHTRRGRRSGISTVIGAIFFVLVVFLVFTSTVLIFESFSGYANSVRRVNQQDIQNKATSLGISSLVFGGVASPTATEVLAPSLPNAPLPPRALLPVQNMNFSGNMNGWTFARTYKVVRDNGVVNNTFLNILPGITGFSLRVSNADPPGGPSLITKVSLLVDPRFSDLCSPSPIACPPPNALWNFPTISGHTITWRATAGNGLPPDTGCPGAGCPLLFNWTALAPAVPDDYYQTATLTWLTIFKGAPLVDSGSATMVTTVVTSGPGGISSPAVCSSPPHNWNICAQPPGVVPGGAFGGYDRISNQIGSESGPGSGYLAFQPTYNGTSLTAGQQLTGVLNFTTAFYIDSQTASHLALGAADAINFGYSLDNVLAPPNPVVEIQAFLIQLDPTGSTVNNIQLSNIVPTQLAGSNVNSSGWITCSPDSPTCSLPYFDPNAVAAAYCTAGMPDCQPTWTWSAGVYEVVISVLASMPGANPGGFYPVSLSMHFDDVGLALQEVPTSNFVDNSDPTQLGSFNGVACPAVRPFCMIEIPSSVDPTQVQSIHLTAQLSETPSAGTNVTAYVFIGDVARATISPVWVEVGQVTFSSSVTLNAVIPASASSIYIDKTGSMCSNICVRIYAISPSITFQGLSATVSIVVQTWKQTVITLSVLNNGTVPLHLESAYVAGPNGVSSFSLNGMCPAQVPPPPVLPPCWINGGELLQIPMTYTWATGQTYVATVTTDKGIIVSQTFISP